ncbi:energy transducer TonB [Pseudomonas nitroreducens]|uniref:energy transducer TonB n=1 Tax=Pseudomonas nitroreducens TaxID=46680 RepID=UPI0002DEB7F8|nr:energy transducer TonB [Pseudomonas nitroreducens]
MAREAAAPVAAPSAAPVAAGEPGSIAARLLPKVAAPTKPSPIKAEEAAEAEAEPAVRAPVAPPPRFALQLLRAGECILLVELPTGEPLASRDPAYLLLKDLLRAAGLPDSPQLMGEPVRWPLFSRGNLDQGPQAAREFVQGFVAARLEEGAPCSCLWLVGMPAVRFAGEGDEESLLRELQVEGLGVAWAVPGLERLAEEPTLKADLWRAMRRVRQRWMSQTPA